MNSQQFDRLARQFATARTRRGLLRAFAGGMGGALVLPWFGTGAAAQPCGADGESCETQDCCEGLVCGSDLACVVAETSVSCGFEGESCENQPCCVGLACGDDQSCFVLSSEETCGAEGESCETRACCEGLLCGGDLACTVAPTVAQCGTEGASCESQACCDVFVSDADLVCVAPIVVETCGVVGESCENQPCCEDSVCGADLTCVVPESEPVCGVAGTSCENQPCCDGLVCGADLACVIPEDGSVCGADGESCENQACCDGLICGEELACVAPAVEPTCGAEGGSCENQLCCDGLLCSDDLACVDPAATQTCGAVGESCENRDCCSDLVCSADVACVVPASGATAGTPEPEVEPVVTPAAQPVIAAAPSAPSAAPASGSGRSGATSTRAPRSRARNPRSAEAAAVPSGTGASGRTAPQGTRSGQRTSNTRTGRRTDRAATLASADDFNLPELAIAVTAEGLQLPAEIDAGRYLVTVTNETDEASLVQLLLPSASTSIEDLTAQIVTLSGQRPDPDDLQWLFETRFAGGGEAPADGAAQAIVDLDAGRWFVANLSAPAAETIAEMTVTGDPPDDLESPEADATISVNATDDGYAFTFEGEFASGRQVISIRNRTDEPHLVVPFRSETVLSPEAVQTLVTRLERGNRLGIDARLPNGIDATVASGLISADQTFWWIVDLEPGFYTLTCPLPGRDGTPHLEEGMIEQIEIAEASE